jgi:hypothetical protein
MPRLHPAFENSCVYFKSVEFIHAGARTRVLVLCKDVYSFVFLKRESSVTEYRVEQATRGTGRRDKN